MTHQKTGRLQNAISIYCSRFDFSAREKEVFTQLAGGVTSSEDIANALGVSRNTIRNHFQNIFYKAKANSKTELLARFIDDLLVTGPPQRLANQPMRIAYLTDSPQSGAHAKAALDLEGIETLLVEVEPTWDLTADLPGLVADDTKLDLLCIDFDRSDFLQLIEHLRQDADYARIPIIVISSDVDSTIRDNIYRLGCSSLLAKPGNPVDLGYLMGMVSQYWQGTARLPV